VTKVTKLRTGRPWFDYGQGRGRDSSLRYRVQTGSEAHVTSYPGGRVAGAWSWPHTCI